MVVSILTKDKVSIGSIGTLFLLCNECPDHRFTLIFQVSYRYIFLKFLN